MNICLVSREYPSETGWGGIGNYTYNLAHGLTELGCQVHVIAQSLDVDKDYFDGKVYVHRVAHKTIFPFKWGFREFFLRLEYSQVVYEKLKQVIKEFDIQIVEFPNFSAEGFVYSLFKKKIPLVVRLHTNFAEVIEFLQWDRTFDRSFSVMLEEAAISGSNLITSSTLFHARNLIGRSKSLKKKLEIIPLGVPITNIKTDCGKELRKPLNVLYVGRLEKRKGIQVLIKAIPHVLKKIPGIVFNIVGRDTFLSKETNSFSGSSDESFKEKLAAEIPEEYRGNVKFTGFVENDELAGYYRQCDVFVAPSLYESFGLIYIEAMSYAKPVIGCSVGGVPEVIEDGISGILVPPEDHLSLAGAIVKLLNNNELRENLGKNARKRVENTFTDTIMAVNTLKAYSNVIENL